MQKHAKAMLCRQHDTGGHETRSWVAHVWPRNFPKRQFRCFCLKSIIMKITVQTNPGPLISARADTQNIPL